MNSYAKYSLFPDKKLLRVFGMALPIALLSIADVFAVDTDAGDYVAAPPGTNMFLFYYQHSGFKNAYSKGHLTSSNSLLNSDIGIIRAVHWTEVGGIVIDPQFLMPFGKLDATGDVRSLRDASGFADLILAGSAWLINDAAKGRYFGVSNYLWLPVGSYNHSNPLNLGENRFKVAFEVFYIEPIIINELFFELVGNETWYGRNGNYGSSGESLTQEPSFHWQINLRYTPTDKIMVGGTVAQDFGGDTHVGGVDQHNTIRTTKAKIALSYWYEKKSLASLTFGRDLSVENGLKVHEFIQLKFLQLF
jgi:hypothetical protein